jgi:phage-related holin
MLNLDAVSEGQVVCFLLATSGILYLRQAIQSGCKVPQVHSAHLFG